LARALFGALDRVGDAQLKTGVVAAPVVSNRNS
jgi:hypothetical protein